MNDVAARLCEYWRPSRLAINNDLPIRQRSTRLLFPAGSERPFSYAHRYPQFARYRVSSKRRPAEVNAVAGRATRLAAPREMIMISGAAIPVD
jgi:hypothetical protein